jgi:GABA(A) receptor-associated protein
MDMNHCKYKTDIPFEKRLSESQNMLFKYPDRIPIICERNGNNITLLDKKKYLVPKNITLGQFIIVLRKRLKITKDKAIFCFIKNKLPIISSDMGNLYNENKDKDGFLYLHYSGENCFGCNIFKTYCFDKQTFYIAINRIWSMNFFDKTSKKMDLSNTDVSLNDITIYNDNNITVNSKQINVIDKLDNNSINKSTSENTIIDDSLNMKELSDDSLNMKELSDISLNIKESLSDDDICDFEII